MSDIYFKCTCGKSLAVDERGVGHVVNCVDCMNLVQVPEPEMEHPCGNCGDFMLMPRSMAGANVQCTLCGHKTKIPMAHVINLWGPKDKPEPEAEHTSNFRPFITRLALAALLLALLGYSGTKLIPRVLTNNQPQVSAQNPIDPIPEPPPAQVIAETPTPAQPVLESNTPADPEPVKETPRKRDMLAILRAAVIPDETSPAAESPEIELTIPETEPSPLPAEPETPEDSTEITEHKAKPTESEELTRLIENLQPMVAKAGLLGDASGAPAALKTARETLLDYVRKHDATGTLTRTKWANAFWVCHEWSLRHELRTHAAALAATTKALSTLRALSEENNQAVVEAASQIAMQYADTWMDTHAREAIRLVDETEEWVLARPGGKKEWYSTIRYVQGGFLYQEQQFREDEREWLRQSREERLRAYVTDEDTLNLNLRTRVLVHWARSLYHQGRDKEAHALLTDWQEKYSDKIVNAEFMRWMMTLSLFEKGNRRMAGAVLKSANKHKVEWSKQPSAQRAYEALCAMYYDNIGLLDYQLIRWRNIEKKKPVRRTDS